MTVERHADEFICRDCGRSIVSLPAREPLPEVCALCQWLAEYIDDEAEREALRRRYASA